MWRVFVAVAFFALWACYAGAQSQEEMDAVMLLTGCTLPEEMDEYEIERLSHYIEHPVRINTVSLAFLRSCGLFTSYQAASLTDYRMRHGDVMSLTELSSVDGFTPEKVRALSPFISLEGGTVNGMDSQTSHDLAVKGGAAVSDGVPVGGYGLKYRCESSGRWSAAFAFSRASCAMYISSSG